MFEIFKENGLVMGRMLSGSKSFYNQQNPNNIVVFNSNVVVDGNKVWHGDLDITKDLDKLFKISKTLNKDLYILREMDARFENEGKPNINNYVAKFSPNETVKVRMYKTNPFQEYFEEFKNSEDLEIKYEF
jgi:hypothetical protein